MTPTVSSDLVVRARRAVEGLPKDFIVVNVRPEDGLRPQLTVDDILRLCDGRDVVRRRDGRG